MVDRLSRSFCLALLMMFTLVSTAAGVELVVVAASSSSNVPAELGPAPGVPCADALKTLKAAGFKITDVQGGAALTYTLARESWRQPTNPAVVIVICAPQVSEAPA